MVKSGLLSKKIIHLHPTNVCNLNCHHCYSSSSPFVKDEIDVKHIRLILRTLKLDGYEVLSVSGGEPLVYKKLDEIIDYANQIGMSVSLITNGMLLNRMMDVSSKINMFAISIDGTQEKHDKLRNKQGCFATLEKNLKKLNENLISFGLVFCVTKDNIDNLTDVYEISVKYKAKLLQLRPLVNTGRGKTMNEYCLSTEDINRLYLIAKLLEQASSDISVHIDLLPKSSVEYFRNPPHSSINNDVISNYVNPIVITEKGEILPYAYGIDSYFSLGNVYQSWEEIMANYKNNNYLKIKNLVMASFDEFFESNNKIIDWYQLLISLSSSYRVN